MIKALITALIVCAEPFFLEVNCNMQVKVINEHITISHRQSFEYSLGSFKEEEIRIKTQAKNFETSEIIINMSNNITYKYKPEMGFLGTDIVEIIVSRDSDGGDSNIHVCLIKIEFNVIE